MDTDNDQILITEVSERVRISGNAETFELSAEEFPYTLKLKRDSFENEKDLSKFIRSCERIIRTCPEYKIWTEYVREVLGFHSCSLTGELHYQTNVDIHHHPISLYTYVLGVCLEKINKGLDFDSFDICHIVLKNHYEMKVPFICLLKSYHDKFHNGALELPMEFVHGDYKHFMETYSSYLEEDVLETINERLRVNKENCGWYIKIITPKES